MHMVENWITTLCLKQSQHFSCKSERSTEGTTHNSSVLWHCRLSIRRSTRSVKIEGWGAGMVVCLEKGKNDLYTGTPSPLASLKSRMVLWFYLSDASLSRSSWKRGICHQKALSNISNFGKCFTWKLCSHVLQTHCIIFIIMSYY